MMEHRVTVTAIGVGIIVVTAAYADMMPLGLDAEHGNTVPPFATECRERVRVNGTLAWSGVDDLNLLIAAPEWKSNDIVGLIPAPQTVEILSDKQNSLDLCLYALIGLGLCRSAPWVKKFSFYHIPEWYHHAGPYQIGHSHAIGPDCLSRAVVCFVQPDPVPLEEPSPQYRGEALISLWRQSQFTPTTLASRGPPSCSC